MCDISIYLLCFQFGDDSEVVEGTYSYLTPEGEEVEVAYTANENGYFPTVSDKINEAVRH